MKRIVIVLVFGARELWSFAQNAAKSESEFIKDFNYHWMNAKRLAVAVAKAMPAENYSFRATAEEMSFGEQMTHLTGANFGYCAFIADTKSLRRTEGSALSPTKQQINSERPSYYIPFTGVAIGSRMRRCWFFS